MQPAVNEHDSGAQCDSWVVRHALDADFGERGVVLKTISTHEKNIYCLRLSALGAVPESEVLLQQFIG